MRAITPEAYKQPEQIVSDWIREQGFFVCNLTYHEHLPHEVVSILQKRRSPSAMIIRTRADRLAIAKDTSIEFQLEIKSPGKGHWANMLIEMLPLAAHMVMAREFVCKCIYAYVDPQRKIQPGFWVHERPPVWKVKIPTPGKSDAEICWYESIAERHFPEATVQHTDMTFGSGDPFVIVTDAELDKLHDWRDLVGVAMSR